jgi:predicted transcriptional regulator of viral defense system
MISRCSNTSTRINVVFKTVPSWYGFDMESVMDRLLHVAAQQRGYVAAAEAYEVEVNPVELRKLAGRGRLEHVGHGLYRFPTFPRRQHDDLMAAVLWTGRRGVIGGQSALDLHELCDVNPRRIDLTVPRSYRPRRRGGDLYRIRHGDLDDGEIEEVADIPVVVPVRAIRDGIADGVDPQLLLQAIDSARHRGEIDDATLASLRHELVQNWFLPTDRDVAQ